MKKEPKNNQTNKGYASNLSLDQLYQQIFECISKRTENDGVLIKQILQHHELKDEVCKDFSIGDLIVIEYFLEPILIEVTRVEMCAKGIALEGLPLAEDGDLRYLNYHWQRCKGIMGKERQYNIEKAKTVGRIENGSYVFFNEFDQNPYLPYNLDESNLE